MLLRRRGILQEIANRKSVALALILSIDTTKAGSASDTFIMPTVASGYDAVIKWGDGTSTNVTGTPGNITKVYGVAGTYQITISGIFPYPYFNNGGDKLKLVGIDNLGNPGFLNDLQSAFYGCANNDYLNDENDEVLAVLTNGYRMFYGNSLTTLPAGMTLDVLTDGYQMFQNNSLTDLPAGMNLDVLTNGRQMFTYNSLTDLPANMTLAALTDGYAMFYDNSLTDLPANMTLAALTDGYAMFYDNSLTALPAGMTLDVLTNGGDMFRYNSLTALPSGMILAALTDGTYMFYGNTINTTRYSQLLVDMEANNTNDNVPFHGGYSKYNSAGEIARNKLIARGWTINDGGLEI